MMRLLTTGVALVAAGCTVGANFDRPQVTSAPAYGAEPTDVAGRTVAGAVDVRWWDRFQDLGLSSLVDRLGRQNLDLQQSAERIQQARSERQVAA